ncbi:UNVERIFIED_CONTAM: hypothetical protein FKN15_074294 [Acipenser sinensis]
MRIQERQKELEELKQAVESLKRSSQRFFQESEKIFTQLIRSIEKIRSEVTELIGAQEKATVNQAEGIMKKLEQEIAELRRRNAELKQLSETKDHIHFLQRSSQREIKQSEKIFTELIRSIEKIRSEVTELIGAKKKAAVNQAEGLMKKLQQEIAELRRRNAEFKQLSDTEDHIHFLQNFESLCGSPEAGDLPSITVNPSIYFGFVREAVSQLKEHIEDFCKKKLIKITKTGYVVGKCILKLWRFCEDFRDFLNFGIQKLENISHSMHNIRAGTFQFDDNKQSVTLTEVTLNLTIMACDRDRMLLGV